MRPGTCGQAVGGRVGPSSMGHGHGMHRGIAQGVEMTLSLEGVKRGAQARCMQGYSVGY